MKKQENGHKKGLAARVLGDTPSSSQKGCFNLMTLTLILWPEAFVISLFPFCAPVHSTIDAIGLYGMVLTIWLYPLYLFPLMRVLFCLSRKKNAAFIYYLTPVVPIVVCLLFTILCIYA